jgi:hypothetical protein
VAKSNPGLYGAKQLAADAICCALILGFSLMFSSLAYLSRSVFGVLIAAIFAFYFTKKPLVRSLTAGAATALLMIMLQGVTLAVSVSIPNVLGGIVLSLALQKSEKVYYLIAAPALAAITAGEYLLVSKLMMNRPIFETLQEALSKYDFIQIPEAEAGFYLTCYLICFCFVMAGMKSVIVQKICRILRRHLPQLGN